MVAEGALANHYGIVAAGRLFCLHQPLGIGGRVDKLRGSEGLRWVNSSTKVPGSAKERDSFQSIEPVVVVALRATVHVALQLIGMYQLTTLRTLDPPTKPVFLSGLNLNFGLFT